MSNAVPIIRNKLVPETIISISDSQSLDSFENEIELHSNYSSLEGNFFQVIYSNLS